MQIKAVSPESDGSEELPIKDAEQLPTPIKTVLPELNDSVEPPTKDAEQLPTPSRMVPPDLLASNTTRTLR